MFGPSGATVEQVDENTVFFQGAVSNSSCASLVKQLWKMQSEHIQKYKDEIDIAINKTPVVRSAANLEDILVVLSKSLQAGGLQDTPGSIQSKVLRGKIELDEEAIRTKNEEFAKATNPIHIHIMSPGGSLQGCFAVIDEMIEMQERDPLQYEGFSIPYRKLHTHTFGASASAAAMIALAGRNRSVGTRDSFLIHQLSAGTYGTLETMKNSMRNFDMYTNSAYEYILERTGIHHYAYWYDWKNRDDTSKDIIVYVTLCPCTGDRKHDIFTHMIVLRKVDADAAKDGGSVVSGRADAGDKKEDATTKGAIVEYDEGMFAPKGYEVMNSDFPKALNDHVRKGHDSSGTSKLKPVIYDAATKELMPKGEPLKSGSNYKRLFNQNEDLMNTWKNIMKYRMEKAHRCDNETDFYCIFKRFMEADVFLTSAECQMMKISTEETWSVDPSWDLSSDSAS